jgi:ketosteroid isomerase-like protein
MRTSWLGLIVAGTFSGLNALAGEPTVESTTVVKAEQQVLALDSAWADAEVRHDAAALRRILDDHFIATFGAGKPYDKEGFIKTVIGGAPDPTEAQNLSDRTVRVDADTAVIVETDTVHGTDEGKAYTTVYRLTTVYIRRNGRWVALAEHLVRAPPDK